MIEIQALVAQAQDLSAQAHAGDDPRGTAETHPAGRHRRVWKRRAGR